LPINAFAGADPSRVRGRNVSAPENRYPWYETIRAEGIEQGDILRNFPVLVTDSNLPVGADHLQGEIRTFDVVILTLSCDLENDKIRSVLLCPVHNLWLFVEEAKKRNENWSSEIREKLRQGNLPGYHLLADARQDGLELPLAVVDFHDVYTAPIQQVKQFAAAAAGRLRLCPPYKEHLAQAFARFFMRVGLPVPIPRDKLKNR
jgi:hypothetical protein